MKAGEIFIGGDWRHPLTNETYQPINPANEEPLAQVGKGDERDIDLAVAAARKAFDEGPWPKMSPHERGRIVWRLGDLIQQNLDEMAKLESLCTGIAAEKMTEDDLRELEVAEKRFARLARALRAREPGEDRRSLTIEWMRANHGFHDVIYRAASNRTLMRSAGSREMLRYQISHHASASSIWRFTGPNFANVHARVDCLQCLQ